MEFSINQLNYFNGCLTLPVPRQKINMLNTLQKAIEKGKSIEVKIGVKREARSLNANAYLWVLLGRMAEVLHTDKDELYMLMLSRYGVFTHVVVKPNVVERVKAEWKLVKELGPVTINGKQGIQLQCYFGSHTYNTKEFSRLLEGVIDEAKRIDVEVKSDAEIQSLLAEWGDRCG